MVLCIGSSIHYFLLFFWFVFFGVLFLVSNLGFAMPFYFIFSQGGLFNYLILKLSFSHEIILSQLMLKQRNLASYLLLCFTVVPLGHLQTSDTTMS